MRFMVLAFAAFCSLLGAPLQAQDLAGDWQGTLQASDRSLRLIISIMRDDTSGWTGTLHSIDQSIDWGAGAPVAPLTIDRSQVKFSVAAVRGSFEGTISADRSTIDGTWTQRQPVPLVLRRATPETAWKDPSPHVVRSVVVDKDVQLETLDWGGSGPPLIFLAGLGNTAHVFDTFALKFTATRHVYGITRRGFGGSSDPRDGYSADRLADDVLAAIDALKLERPVLVGHSLAGEEMSSIASRHPERVSGLIYLDAGYSYAFYDAARGDLEVDLADLRRKLEQLTLEAGPPDRRPLIKELLGTDLPRFEHDLQTTSERLDATPPAVLALQAQAAPGTRQFAVRAIPAGYQKFTRLSAVPILAIYAVPHDLGSILDADPGGRAAFEARDTISTGGQADAFEKGVPSARVVRLPHANHSVFLSNEADVLREMNAFLAALK